MRACGVWITAAAAGCMVGDELSVDAGAGPRASGGSAAFEAPQIGLRVSLAPTQLRDSAESGYRVLPQTFPTAALQDAQSIVLGDLELLGPVVQIAVGLYLFFDGRWVADKAIPGNHPYCHECGYDLTGAAGNICAECGTPFKAAS